MQTVMPCVICKHWDGDDSRNAETNWGTCPAYPKGIPKEIYFGFDFHEEVRDDQEGDLVFELIDKLKSKKQKK